MRIEDEVKLDFNDVLIRPKRSTLNTRADVDLIRTYKFLHSKRIFVGIPIIASNMDGVGTMEMAQQLASFGMLTALTKHVDKDEFKKWFDQSGAQINCFWAWTVGSSTGDAENFDDIYKFTSKAIGYVCIDVANGYHANFIDTVQRYRDNYPDVTIIAGNVVTGEMTEELLLSGADIVKVGIGPGSVCTTRLQTGVGYPQLSATIECADAAHGLGGHIISDGGCRYPGDIAKAFGGGADFVMLGGMLAGHLEGLSYEDYERFASYSNVFDKTIPFYGSSSETAMHKHYGSKADYRAAEGKEVEVKYKGPVKETVEEILGGLRSSCTYVGARTLKEFSKRTTFIRVNRTHDNFK